MFGWSVLDDVRVALRGFFKAPGLAFVVVLTLAVAIGANTAIFSVVEGVLLSPLPYPEEGRIVRVGATTFGGADSPASFSDRGYWHFVDNNRSFEKFGAYRVQNGTIPLTGDGSPLLLEGTGMSLSAFEALGVRPEIGRLPTPEEDAPGGARVVLLSHELWVSRYGADASILGRTINLLGFPCEIIGVMPAGYGFPAPAMDVWFPLALNPASANFGGHNIRAIAKLAPGVTIEAATQDARGLIARFGEVGYGADWLEGIWNGGAIVRPLREEIVGDVRQPLFILLGTVGLVLLIACSNIANLLLVREEGRRQENAVRMALGAGSERLARYMLVESALLALAGGAAGVLLANLGVRALVAIAPPSIPRLDEIGIDGTVLAVTTAASALAGLLAGLLPAIRSSSVRTMAALRDRGRTATGSRTRHRLRNALVTTQVALAFVVVIGAGLMLRSFEALRSVDPGFSADGVLTFELQPLPTKYRDNQAAAQLHDRLIERWIYLPAARGAMTMTVRTTVEPLSVVNAIRSAIAELDADLPMGKIQTMERVLGDSMSRTSFTASMLLIAALVALFLGSVGIYAVLSYVVSQRTAEIGIRTALGATPESVRRMVLSQGLSLVAVGVLIGLAAAVALGRLLATQLYGVRPFDPVTIAAAAAIFVAVALFASLIPAARAAGTSPLDALRVG